MPRRLTWLFVMLLCASQACGNDPPTAPTPAPAVPASRPLLNIPEIRGVVREVDGGPIAGASVIKSSLLKGGGVATQTDSNGLFMFPASLDVGEVSLWASVDSWGEQYVWSGSVRVFPSTNPSPVSVEIRLQPVLTVSEAQALETTLSAEDLRFPFLGEGVDCGPCKVILVKPGSGGAGVFDIRVHAATAGPLRLALIRTPLSYGFDEELIGQASSPPESSDVTLRTDRDQLAVTPSVVTVLYVWRPNGPHPASIRVSLVRVQ